MSKVENNNASPVSNWPCLNAVNPFSSDEKSLVMRIVNFVTWIFMGPLAFVADLAIKAVNWIFPEEVEAVKPELTRWQKVKDAAHSALVATKDFFVKHKKAAIITGSVVALGTASYFSFPYVKARFFK
jgi:hypothetical protein